MLWLFHIIAVATPVGVPTTANILGEAAGAALQANAPRALELLKKVDPSTLQEKDRHFVLCMRERFGTAAGHPQAEAGPMADRLLDIYRDYWRSAALRPGDREAEEKRLELRLRTLFGGRRSAGIDELEPLVAAALTKDGFHSLQGQTGLLRDLMIWSRQDTKTMRVPLPEGAQDVKVVLLDDFKSLGWGYYAACGRRGAGGWATKDALFAIVPRYESLDSEEFRVSFLGHEAQHFADLRRFKDIKPWELEYRAKLTELALANVTRPKILDKFVENQGDDPASPHSYANKRILADLVARLGLGGTDDLFIVELSRLNEAAAGVLREDSVRRVIGNAPKNGLR